MKLLHTRHPELDKRLIETIVQIAHKIRLSPELTAGLSVRATEEACIILKHPLMEGQEQTMLPEVLRSSFGGRFGGRTDDAGSDAGLVWNTIEASLEGD